VVNGEMPLRRIKLSIHEVVTPREEEEEEEQKEEKEKQVLCSVKYTECFWNLTLCTFGDMK
jgi:hypothetical protein